MILRNVTTAGAEALRRLQQRSTSNFKFAFLFLGPSQRAALEHVYQFCRVVDDIVDDRPTGPTGRDVAERGLDVWRQEIARIYQRGRAKTELGHALVRSVEHFGLPRHAFDEIIEGCAMDLDVTTYADRHALELYCYRVASCVGVLCIGIFGDQSTAAQRYAHHLGLALQYTNILRDIGEDAARGRVYLPLDLLAEHDLQLKDVLACRYDARFLAMAEAFADIADSEYQKAWAELPAVKNRRNLLPAEVMGRTYYEILTEIREHEFNVFTHRASLRRRDKLRVAAVALAQTNLPFGLGDDLGLTG